MSPAAFIDANIPIYAGGRDHPYKEPCNRVIGMAVRRPWSFFTDTEVLQELMHRYRSSHRWSLGRRIFRSFAEVMRNRVEPVYLEDVELAGDLADRHPEVSSRDLVHAAVMKRLGIDRIVSADTDFDRLPGLERLDPANVAQWQDSVLARQNKHFTR